MLAGLASTGLQKRTRYTGPENSGFLLGPVPSTGLLGKQCFLNTGAGPQMQKTCEFTSMFSTPHPCLHGCRRRKHVRKLTCFLPFPDPFLVKTSCIHMGPRRGPWLRQGPKTRNDTRLLGPVGTLLTGPSRKQRRLRLLPPSKARVHQPR